MELENVLKELVRPLCNHPELLEVEGAESEDGKEVVLTIKATSSDIGSERKVLWHNPFVR